MYEWSVFLPCTVKEALVSALPAGLVATHTYMAVKDGRVRLNSKVLCISLSVFPFIVVIVTPVSVVRVRFVRELLDPTLYHVMEGLGLAIAVQTNMAEAGWVTINAASSVMVGVAGGTVKKVILIVSVQQWTLSCELTLDDQFKVHRVHPWHGCIGSSALVSARILISAHTQCQSVGDFIHHLSSYTHTHHHGCRGSIEHHSRIGFIQLHPSSEPGDGGCWDTSVHTLEGGCITKVHCIVHHTGHFRSHCMKR